VNLRELEARLRARQASAPLFEGRRAAVAMLLCDGPDGPEVLLMKRREHPGDRWSGHVSLPGGKEAPDDADLAATAARETLEEVGIDLGRSARLIGRLDSVRARAEGKVLPMTIAPFVYVAVGTPAPALREEAESVFWLPLAVAASGALDAIYQHQLGPLSLRLPCWRYQGYVIWGLTYGMLRKLLEIAAYST
jgi:8-oxo-dGTP pyrophosphatase MutT (NUDIX family)